MIDTLCTPLDTARPVAATVVGGNGGSRDAVAVPATVITCLRVDALTAATDNLEFDLTTLRIRHAALEARLHTLAARTRSSSGRGGSGSSSGSGSGNTVSGDAGGGTGDSAGSGDSSAKNRSVKLADYSTNRQVHLIASNASRQSSLAAVLVRELPPRLPWVDVPAVLQPSSTEDGAYRGPSTAPSPAHVYIYVRARGRARVRCCRDDALWLTLPPNRACLQGGLGHNESRVQRKQWQLESLFKGTRRTRCMSITLQNCLHC